MHDFGLNLQKLIDIQPKKNCNILAEGTFGLYDKKEEKVVQTAYDYKQLLETARKIIKYDEDNLIWPENRFTGEQPKFWQLLQFLKHYDLVFHEFTPIQWQQRHRLEFINELYNSYYACKFEFVKSQSLYGTPLGYLFSDFIKFKKLQNRITMKKFPVLCSLVTTDDIKKTDELIAYLFDQFEQNEFTLDVKTEKYEGTRVLLALKDQSVLNYIGLTVLENWKIDGKIDFSPLIGYMDAVEKYIETDYLI